jgi:periplasmic divalent cation tolerance protein
MEKTDYIVVFITAGNDEEAGRIADLLVKQRLAACVNIVPGVESRFWWQGKLDTAGESLLIAKSRAAMLPEIISKVKKAHSYDVPEIIALPVLGGNPEYLAWLEEEVARDAV